MVGSAVAVVTAASPNTGALVTRLLRTAEKLNVGLALMAVVAVHLGAGFGAMWLGTLLGALVNIANFRVIVWVGTGLVRAGQKRLGFYGAVFFVKMAALMAIVWLILSRLDVTPLGFIIGLATFLPAVLLTTLGVALKPAAARSTSGSL